ncbi:hypothetical protein L1987_20375 [Smallanthus sonchifolius]|uniref:Uncharacterized protein n=1 Tax=Smallanthus sonchifolius TaxID=185202 RepID=A0ACB9ITB6_9ASTR|nr:hypothetical protein L1987_20375 [Smallanthus sonchifolius]
MGDASMTATSPSEIMDEINLNESSTSNDDDVVVGLDEEFLDSKKPNSNSNRSLNPFSEDYVANEKTSASDDFFRFESTDNEDLFADRPMPEWVGWNEPIVGSGVNPFEDYDNTLNLDMETPVGEGPSLPNGSTPKDDTVPSSFEEDVEFVGVELDG